MLGLSLGGDFRILGFICFYFRSCLPFSCICRWNLCELLKLGTLLKFLVMIVITLPIGNNPYLTNQLMRTDCIENSWEWKLEWYLGHCLETELRLSYLGHGDSRLRKIGISNGMNEYHWMCVFMICANHKKINKWKSEKVKKKKRKWEKHKNRKKRKRKDGEHKSTGNKSWMDAFELVSQIRE